MRQFLISDGREGFLGNLMLILWNLWTGRTQAFPTVV